MKDNPPEPHWTDRHITPGYLAWDETNAHPIGYYPTKKEAKQALLDYAKTLNKGEEG